MLLAQLHNLIGVFLDEIGDLDAGIQVKLLRVLQNRTFQRLGETEERTFAGRVIAATNRNLDVEMQQGRFREDFYYRLCSDVVRTPSLAQQLADYPDDLGNLVLFLARRVARDAAEPLAEEVTAWIEANLGRDYSWPGNFRELEQCLRNIMIRNTYCPAANVAQSPVRAPAEELTTKLQSAKLTADQLLRRYCTLVYAQTGSYEQAARRLKLDRRTVKSKVDPELLDRWGTDV
jgi:transcriptional regulator with PAS, ATPase and Fis domain